MQRQDYPADDIISVRLPTDVFSRHAGGWSKKNLLVTDDKEVEIRIIRGTLIRRPSEGGGGGDNQRRIDIYNRPELDALYDDTQRP